MREREREREEQCVLACVDKKQIERGGELERERRGRGVASENTS